MSKPENDLRKLGQELQREREERERRQRQQRTDMEESLRKRSDECYRLGQSYLARAEVLYRAAAVNIYTYLRFLEEAHNPGSTSRSVTSIL